MSAYAVAAKAPLFDALGDPNRLRIITRLCDGGPCSTTEVTQVVAVSRQAATKHLLLLEAVGLVNSQRKGRERIWRVQPEPLTDASEYLTGLSQRWDRAIDQLRVARDNLRGSSKTPAKPASGCKNAIRTTLAGLCHLREEELWPDRTQALW